MPEETVCRVCGYDAGEVRWEHDCPTYDICDCCGSESGYEDMLVEAVRAHRQRWLDAGTPWWGRGGPPPGWTPTEQLTRVAPEWR